MAKAIVLDEYETKMKIFGSLGSRLESWRYNGLLGGGLKNYKCDEIN